ncbi:MAG: TIGR04500 family putative peptide maturation system protein [bacterium]
MTDDLARKALGDTLTFLGELARDAVRPREALTRLATLRLRHPELSVDLVWEEQPYPGTVHYDALLRERGADTVSLSVCPVSDVPWPLRGVRLASDQDLVRVNGETLKVRDAMDTIDFLWNDTRILRPLVDMCLIAEAVKERGVEPSAEHTQRALDAFRTSHGLLSARETLAWMTTNDLTHERFEQMVRVDADAFALRDRVAGNDGVQAYWRAHPGAFDIAHVVRLRVRDRDRAEVLAVELRNGGDFYVMLEREFAARRLMALARGPLEMVRRGQLPPEHADAIFAARAGDLVGPLAGDGVHDLVRVIRVETADFADAATRNAVSDAVFDAWIAEQRQAATIEWFWGPVGAAV